MNHLKKCMFGALALALASCNSEEPVNQGTDPGQNDGNVYASLNIKLPSAGTRAGNAGEEYGQDDENYVGKILVVLTTKNEAGDYIFLAYDEADAMDDGVLNPGDHENVQKELKYTLNFHAKDLVPDGIGTAGDSEQDVYVFAFCNPTERLKTTISQWVSKTTVFNGSATGLIDETNNVWTPKKFLMTNCHIPTAVRIPTRADLVQNHSTPEKAFSLGTVHVKRVAARFDFALGGTSSDNKYEIKNINGEGVMGTVELTDMAMFNISKNFYYLPRTNEKWDWTGNTTLCGDLEDSYVMSFNQGNFKTSSLSSNINYKNFYFANLIGNTFAAGNTDVTTGGSTALAWTSIRPTDWNSKTEDTNEGWTQDPKNDYRIWRYATENTIPGGTGNSTATQKIGITTGVVFKGEFTPTNTTVWNGNVIYTYNGIVYGDYTALKGYVEKYPDAVVSAAFNNTSALKTPAAGTNTDTANLLAGLTSAQCNGFKAYVSTGGKYIMYYFYYNRHNTNGNNSQMGVNEFGVVRNNVYKLKVTACGSLGEPTAPENPDKPNEEENAYFTVSCHVMPWTVRINNIEF